MKKAITLLFIMIGFQIIDQLVVLSNPELEPLFSLNYLKNVISYSLNETYPIGKERYIDEFIEGFQKRTWLTPTIEAAITFLILYIIIYIIRLLYNRLYLMNKCYVIINQYILHIYVFFHIL